MRGVNKQDLILCAIILVTAIMMGSVTNHLINKRMYEIAIKVKQDTIKLKADRDGLVIGADGSDSFWNGKVVINVDQIKAGDTLSCYDISTDVISKAEFPVVSITKE